MKDNFNAHLTFTLRFEPILKGFSKEKHHNYANVELNNVQSNSVTYNKHGWDQPIWFVIAVIRYNCENLCTKVNIWGLETTTLFLCYSREFVITVIVITEFECMPCSIDHRPNV